MHAGQAEPWRGVGRALKRPVMPPMPSKTALQRMWVAAAVAGGGWLGWLGATRGKPGRHTHPWLARWQAGRVDEGQAVQPRAGSMSMSARVAVGEQRVSLVEQLREDPQVGAQVRPVAVGQHVVCRAAGRREGGGCEGRARSTGARPSPAAQPSGGSAASASRQALSRSSARCQAGATARLSQVRKVKSFSAGMPFRAPAVRCG